MNVFEFQHGTLIYQCDLPYDLAIYVTLYVYIYFQLLGYPRPKLQHNIRRDFFLTS